MAVHHTLSGFRSQRGATLLIGLIMLVVLTLMVVTAFNLGKGNLEIVGNMQHRQEALSAAQSVTETALLSPNLFDDPANLFTAAQSCATNKICVDINSDGTNDIEVDVVVRRCVSTPPVKVSELDLTNEFDLQCAVGVQQTFGVAGSVSANSLCTNEVAEVEAHATDAVTGADVTTTQGVSIRQNSDDVMAACP